MTKNLRLRFALIIGAGLLMPPASPAALANFNGMWSTYYNPDNITVTNILATAGTNAAVSFDLNSSGDSWAAGGVYNSFTATTLGTNTGDSVTLKFTIAFTTNTGSAANLDKKLSFGLSGSDDKLFALVDTGTAGGSGRLTFGGYVDSLVGVGVGTLYRGDLGQPVTNSSNTYTGTFNTGAGAALDTTYTMKLTRTAGGADFIVSQTKSGNNWTSTVFSVTTAEANAIMLDKVFIGLAGGTGGDWKFTGSNLSVDVIPAPAGSALVVIPTKLNANWESGTWDSGLTPAPILSFENVGDTNTTTVADTNRYVEASSNFARSGNYSFKSFAQPPALRSEIGFMDAAYQLNPGEEYYYSASYCPGTNWQAVSLWSTILTQWKNFSSGPSAVFRMKNDGSLRPEFESQAGGGDTYVFDEPLPANEWTDFVFYFKWTTNSTGMIKIWRNGNLVLNITGPTLLLNSAAYMKIGMYTGIGQPRTIYIDNVRIGTNVLLNFPPVFTNNPISAADAARYAAYSGTIAGSATDADGDLLTYSKVSGPAWLSVSTNGALSGTPGGADAGTNTFMVKVADGHDGVNTAALNIVVTKSAAVKFGNNWTTNYQTGTYAAPVTGLSGAGGTNASVSFQIDPAANSLSRGGVYNTFATTVLGTNAGDFITYKLTVATYVQATGVATNVDRKVIFGVAGADDKMSIAVDAGTANGTKIASGVLIDSAGGYGVGGQGELFRTVSTGATNSALTGIYTLGPNETDDTMYTMTLARLADGSATFDVSQVKPGNNWSAAQQTFTKAQADALSFDKVFVGWAGNVDVPNLQYTVTDLSLKVISEQTAVSYTLTTSAGANGTISPTNATVLAGGSATFVVTASNYYRIATLKTNNADVIGMSFDNNSTTTNFIWGNVQTSGVLAATFTAQVVTNAANTPYEWLARYGLTNYNTDAAADQDSDGLIAWQEYIAGTVPTNAASCFKAAQNTRDIIIWSAVSGRVYSVYWSTNLMKGFTNLNNNILYPQSSYTNANPDARVNHYQIKVRLQ